MTITYRADYSGHVDDERVAWTYRAYNEEGSPYVVVLDDRDGPPISLTQAPVESLDGVADEAADLTNAQWWVHRLTRLIEKARAYDEIFDDIEDAGEEFVCGGVFHDLHVVEDDDDFDAGTVVKANLWLPSDAPSPLSEAYTVDELTDLEVDSEWVDSEGDHLKYIDGEWYINDGGETPWEPMSEYTYIGDLLADYGPYQVALP